MEKLINTSIEEQLLQSREQRPDNMDVNSMRPLGKLWGMDVFSWSNPSPGVIANTILSFPFPVIWIGNSIDIQKTLHTEMEVCQNLSAMIVRDNSIFSFNNEVLSKVINCAGVENVADSLVFLKQFKSPKNIVLFTSSGENSKLERVAFEKYIKEAQGQ